LLQGLLDSFLQKRRIRRYLAKRLFRTW